jgi:hypothetical protein
MTNLGRAFLTLAFLASVAGSASVQAKEVPPRARPAIDPQAEKMLRQMTDYLASLKSFKVQSSAVDELVTTGGQKIQIASESVVYVERPNRLRSEQVGAENGLAFWYDGKNMTLACPTSKTFATAAAPPTIDATIDAARKKFEIEAPGADLLYSRPYEILTEQVTGGRFIGRETIGRVAVNHLAFTGEEVDWQIWIEDDPQPLPLRFVITTKTMKSQPEFAVQLSRWEPQATFSESTFQFQVPAGATRVQAFPSACPATR